MSDNRQGGVGGSALIVGGILAIVLVVLVLSSLAFVPAGYEGVLLNWGAISGTVLSPGLHFIVPIYQRVVNVNTQVQAFTVLTGGVSKDLQVVPTEVTLNYHINASQVNELYQKIGANYQSNLIAPIVQERVKATEANFSASDLIDERPLVQVQIQQALSQVLPNYYIIVDQLSIVNFSFSPQFSAAIESKVAQQQVLAQQLINVSIAAAKANQTIQAARGNATSVVLKATANATAIMLHANATAYAVDKIQGAIASSPDYLNYLIDSEWKGQVPSTVVGSGSAGVVPFINLNNQNASK